MEKESKFIRKANKEDCAVVRGGKQPIVMEVVGPNGIKLHEYIDKGNDTLPYYELNETVRM